MAGNSYAISVRLQHKTEAKARWQIHHDARTGKVPGYVVADRIGQNSVLIEPTPALGLRALCMDRRGQQKQKFRKSAAVMTAGIITFGRDAQKAMDELSRETQDDALLAVSNALSERLGADLTGLVVHRDETALHAHFEMPAWTRSGVALSKVVTPSVARELQDIAAQTIQRFAPDIERGRPKVERWKAGDDPAELIHKSVARLHEELPREIAELGQRQNELWEQYVKQTALVEKTRKKAAENSEKAEKTAKNLAIYERRRAATQAEIERLTAKRKELRSQVKVFEKRLDEKAHIKQWKSAFELTKSSLKKVMGPDEYKDFLQQMRTLWQQHEDNPNRVAEEPDDEDDYDSGPSGPGI